LCVPPRLLERQVTERQDDASHVIFHVAVRTEFTLIDVDDGSSHII